MKKTFFLLSLIPGLLAALPENPQIQAGDVAISADAHLCQITQRDHKAIINWDNFSIASGETVQFIQPTSSSVALNRVVGKSPSEIFGHLHANGQVFLINQNGVFFAPHASVNTAALLVSTLNMQDADFLAERYQLSGKGGPLLNQGHLKALDHITLVGGQVTNEGLIEVNRGLVQMMAGSKISLSLDDQGLLTAEVEADILNAYISNQGVITAPHVTLSASSSNAVFETVVNNQGLIEAASLERGLGGKIYLKGGSKGVVEASGQMKAPAGYIHASGERTYMASGALADVSSKEGKAGSIYLLGDKQISLHGKAHAASLKGQGGFIETSAPHLNLEGFRAGAPGIIPGRFLIDPVDLTINHSSTNTGGSFNGASPTDTWSGATTPATLGDSVINTALSSATNVIINALSGTGGTGTITLQGSSGNVAAITVPNGHTLEFLAGDGGFVMDGFATITLGDGSSVSITSGTNGVSMVAANDLIAPSTSGQGNVTINTTGPISVANATIGSSALPLATFTVENCTSFTQTDRTEALEIDLISSGNITLIDGDNTTTLGITDTGGPGTTISITSHPAENVSLDIQRMSLPNAPTSVTVITGMGGTDDEGIFALNISTPTGNWNINTDVSITPEVGQTCDISISGFLQGKDIVLGTGEGFSIWPAAGSYLKVGNSLSLPVTRLNYVPATSSTLAIELPSTGSVNVNVLGTWASGLTMVGLNMVNDFSISQLTYTNGGTNQNLLIFAPNLLLNAAFPANAANQFVTIGTTSGNLIFSNGSSVTGTTITANVAGSVVNNSTANPIFLTSGNLAISATNGTIGSLSLPVTVGSPPTATVYAGGYDADDVSIVINGVVGNNTLLFSGVVPGFVFFNGRLLLPFFPAVYANYYLAALAYEKNLEMVPLLQQIAPGNIPKQLQTLYLLRNLYRLEKVAL